jgi:propanol-preferring alcohol dehydrogenase
MTKMIAIKDSYISNRHDIAEALELASHGLINAPFKTVGLNELRNVYEAGRLPEGSG